MSEASLTLIIAIVSSPIWIPAFEYIRNRIWAKISFHGWQVVFLNTPGGLSTYFGHISSVSRTEITLKDIYYLEEKAKASPKNISSLIVSVPQLIKLGEDQLHKPEDVMIINRQYVVFIENMTYEAPVMKMILSHRKNKK